MKQDPRTLIDQLEAAPALPAGEDERFSGYGVMGLPFASGHVLAMRRFPLTSVGPGYAAVWHRTPDGRWTFYANASPAKSCARYFGKDVVAAIETEVTLAWPEPFRLHVTVPAVEFDWELEVAPTAATRAMSAMGRVLPAAAWRSSSVLSMMAMMAGPMLGVGRVGLQGLVPNGQRFIANPRVLWAIVDSRARLAGLDLGAPGPVRPQARLGDFWIPQRGMLAIGQSMFENFDPARHSSRTGAASG